MAQTNVSNASELAAALTAASGGETIILADGDYGPLNVSKVFGSQVVVTGESPRGAVVSSVGIDGTRFLRLEGLHVSNPGNGGPASRVVSIVNSQDVEVVSCEINALVDGTYDGFYGFYTQDTERVRIHDNFVHDVKVGGVFTASTDLVVSNNTYDYLGADSMKFIGVHGVLIEGNFGARHIFPGAGEHLDFIQFQGTDSSEVTIRANVSLPGNRTNVQGIFLDDAQYSDILVEDNFVMTGMMRGVSVNGGSGNIARRNTLIGIPGGGSKSSKVLGFATSAKNIMCSYKYDSGFVHGDNYSAQDEDPGFAHWYGDVLVNPMAGQGATLDDLVPVAGGIATQGYGCAGTIEAHASGVYGSTVVSGIVQPPPPPPDPEPNPDPEPPETSMIVQSDTSFTNTSGSVSVTMTPQAGSKLYAMFSTRAGISPDSHTINDPAWQKIVNHGVQPQSGAARSEWSVWTMTSDGSPITVECNAGSTQKRLTVYEILAEDSVGVDVADSDVAKVSAIQTGLVSLPQAARVVHMAHFKIDGENVSDVVLSGQPAVTHASANQLGHALAVTEQATAAETIASWGGGAVYASVAAVQCDAGVVEPPQPHTQVIEAHGVKVTITIEPQQEG